MKNIAADTTPLIEMRGVSVRAGEKLALDALDLVVAPGEHVAILGANGSGKSTLVKLIARQLYSQAGAQVRVFGRTRWNVRDLRSLLGIVSPAVQGDYTNNERIEAFEAVASGFFDARGLWGRTLTEGMRAAAHEALVRVGACDLAGREMATLSTGEARRVLIARALVHRPRALLLDEPCGGLDPASRRNFMETLRGLARDGTTILLVTHHIEEIFPEIGRVVMLREGRLLRDGPKERLLDSANLTQLFGAPLSVERRGEWYSARLD